MEPRLVHASTVDKEDVTRCVTSRWPVDRREPSGLPSALNGGNDYDVNDVQIGFGVRS
jgi:hypothetical protein